MQEDEKSEHNQKGILFEFSELYESRVCIMVESAPQSNKYHQLLLSKSQFDNISKAIFSEMKNCVDPTHKHPQNHVCLWFSDDPEVQISDKIKSHYSVEEMVKK